MKYKINPKIILLTAFLLLIITACNEDPDAATETAEPATTIEPTEVIQESNGQPELFDPSSVQFFPLIDNENGLSLQYPASWVTQSGGGGTTVASSESIIEAESLTEIGDEAFLVIIPGEIAVFNFQTSQNFTSQDVQQVLETYKVLLEKEGQVYVVVEPPQAFTGPTQNMARMVLRSTDSGEPIITVMAVVMGDSYMALVSAASSQERADELRPIFNRIIESIEVQPPGSFSTDG